MNDASPITFMAVICALDPLCNAIRRYPETFLRPTFPVLGVNLPRAAVILGRLGVFPAVFVASLLLHSPWLQLAVLFLSMYWLLSAQMRLSNHGYLSAIALCLFAFAPAGEAGEVAATLLAGVYLSAGIFKLNTEYLTTPQSPGRMLSAGLLAKLGVTPRIGIVVPMSYLAVVAELVIGLSLLTGVYVQWTLPMAVVMHWSFAMLSRIGIFDYSNIMLALWIIALFDGLRVPETGTDVGFVLAVCLVISIATVARWPSDFEGERVPRTHLVAVAAESLVFGSMAGWLLVGLASQGEALVLSADIGWNASMVELAIAAVFVLNALTVVMGVKNEFSFAMFSGVRPYRRAWFQHPRVRARYAYYPVRCSPDTKRLLDRRFGADFIGQCFRRDMIVNSVVVERLLQYARSQGHVVEVENLDRLPEVSDGNEPYRQAASRQLLFPAIVPRSLRDPYLG